MRDLIRYPHYNLIALALALFCSIGIIAIVLCAFYPKWIKALERRRIEELERLKNESAAKEKSETERRNREKERDELVRKTALKNQQAQEKRTAKRRFDAAWGDLAKQVEKQANSLGVQARQRLDNELRVVKEILEIYAAARIYAFLEASVDEMKLKAEEARRTICAQIKQDDRRKRFHGKNQRKLIEFFERRIRPAIDEIARELRRLTRPVMQDEVTAGQRQFLHKAHSLAATQVQNITAELRQYAHLRARSIETPEGVVEAESLSVQVEQLVAKELQRQEGALQAHVECHGTIFISDSHEFLEEILSSIRNGVSPALEFAEQRLQEGSDGEDDFEDEDEDEDEEDDDENDKGVTAQRRRVLSRSDKDDADGLDDEAEDDDDDPEEDFCDDEDAKEENSDRVERSQDEEDTDDEDEERDALLDCMIIYEATRLLEGEDLEDIIEDPLGMNRDEPEEEDY